MYVPAVRRWLIAVLAFMTAASAWPRLTIRRPHNLTDIHAWSCGIENSESSYHGVWLHAEIYAQRRNWQKVYWVDSREFDLPVGTVIKRLRDVEPLRNQHYEKGYEAFFFRAGTIPADSYRYSLTLMPMGIGDTGAYSVRPVAPPRLISPRDGDSTRETRPQFRWTPAEASGRPVKYQLLIYEILPGQTKEEAAAANPPIFEQRGIPTTLLSLPLSARSLDMAKSYAWRVRALGSDGSSLAESEVRLVSVYDAKAGLRAPSPIRVSRDVYREDNCYRVTLTITNVSADTLSNLTVADRSIGFQAADDATVMHGTTGASYRFTSCQTTTDTIGPRSTLYAGWEKLFPGGRMIICYHTVPVLIPADTIVRRIGDSTAISYSVGTSSFLRNFNATATVSDIGAALSAADYLIITCPHRLFSTNPGAQADVNRLLARVALLAKEKTGVLGFMNRRHAWMDVFVKLISWGTRLAPGWQNNGYLLLVGQDDIVASSSCTVVDFGIVQLTDYPYSQLNMDEQVELRVGRIIGRTASELLVPIQTSLDVWRGLARYDGTRALYVSALEGPFEAFTNQAREIGESLRIRVSDVDRVYGDIYNTHINQLRCGLWIDCGRDIAKRARWLLRERIWNGNPVGTMTRLGQIDSMTTRAAIDSAVAIARRIVPADERPANDTSLVGEGIKRTLADENQVRNRDRYPFALSRWLLTQRGSPIPADTVGQGVAVAEVLRFLQRGIGRYFDYRYYDTREAAGTARSAAVRDSCRERDLIGYRGHGGPGSWAWVLDDWTSSACPAEPLNFGSRRPVVWGFTCLTGYYNEVGVHGPVSIARCFLRNGAGIYIGATRPSYTQANREMILRLIRLWSPSTCFGDAFAELKNSILRDNGWQLETVMYNLYGDPKYRRR